jgi:hypothetical protein
MRVDDLCTTAEAERFIEGIPAELAECAAGRHDWIRAKPVRVTPFSRGGRPLPHAEVAKAAYIEVTEACPVCDLERTTPVDLRGRKVGDREYANRNAALVAPHGISHTGVSVRASTDGAILLRKALSAFDAEVTPITKKRTRKAAA